MSSLDQPNAISFKVSSDGTPEKVVAQRTHSGAYQSADGSLYVSKPYRSRHDNKVRATITFAPRKSHFDTTNELSGSNEFRGFFTLFWISMFIFMVRSYIQSMETHGYIMNFHFAMSLSQHAMMLGISDAILVLSTGLCVPFTKAMANGCFNYHWFGVVIQHAWQTLILFVAIRWTFNQQWPWVQSGFFTLHTLVMIMKMHSYTSVNGYLQWISGQSKEALKRLENATDNAGGWDRAVIAARAHRAELDATIQRANSGTSTPLESSAVLNGSYFDVSAASVLRQRLLSATPTEEPISRDVSRSGSPVLEPPSTTTHVLIDHPDEEISKLALEYSELEYELVSTGPEHVKWPNNISWKNFAVYQLIPTLVYELEFPRTDRIRPMYVFEKTVATFGTFALLYSVTEVFILPQIPKAFEQSFFRSLLDLAMPFMVAYLLLFYIIFECICNGFAELSYFSDRQFYEDWWNSKSWDEFSRKWNKPVHNFLLRHVYASTMRSYKLSKTSAMLITFLLSAAVHELVMAIVTRKIRMYLFILQLIQIPLITIGRIPVIRQHKILGNIVFWVSLYSGFPLLCVAYMVY